MIRATIWTVGLFGAGAAISGMFTAGWTQPLVLVVLGMAFLFVSRSTAATSSPAARAAAERPAAQDLVSKRPARPVAGKPAAPVPAAAPLAATVPVEQSA